MEDVCITVSVICSVLYKFESECDLVFLSNFLMLKSSGSGSVYGKPIDSWFRVIC